MMIDLPIAGRIASPEERVRVVPIDVGRHSLAVPAESLLGVRDDWQIPDDGTSTRHGFVVQCSTGPVPAIRLAGWLGGEPGLERSHLVTVRTTDSLDVFGLFVDHVGRPRTVRRHELYRIPDWYAGMMSVPLSHWAIHSSTGSDTPVRHVIDVDRFRDKDDVHHEALASQVTPNSETGEIAAAHGRGILVFAPADSPQTKMRCGIAVPMSLVLAVLADFQVMDVPTRAPHLEGLVLWHGLPIPVIRLGMALGLDNQELDLASTDRSARMLLLRTPSDQIIGCVTHSQMRTLRTSQATGGHIDHELNADLLFGSFLTADGPIAIPDLDQVLRISAGARTASQEILSHQASTST